MTATTAGAAGPGSAGLTGPAGSAGPRPRRRASAARFVQPAVALGLVAVLLGVPFWLVIVTAGKTRAEALNPNLSLPSHWQLWQNVATVFHDGHMTVAFFGSLLIMVPAVAAVLIIGAMASWVLARRKSRVISCVYALAISGLVLPPAVVTIVLLLRQLGLAGTALGMIGVYMGMYMSTVIFFITGFVRTIPLELEEAARVDGASPARVFFRIILPLLGPTISTATILVSLYIWNDVFYALFVIGGRIDTLPLNLYQVASAGLYLNNWHLIFAYIILMSLPLLITFALLQRRIISGITSGAVK